MKISGSFLTMLIVWLLGFTHLFGGPYFIFKVVFWVMLLPFFISILFFALMIWKAKKLLNFSKRFDKNQNQHTDTIHVEAEVKE